VGTCLAAFANPCGTEAARCTTNAGANFFGPDPVDPTTLVLTLREQNTNLRLSGTVYLHDALMFISLAILVGHLYLALIHPSTRHALRGMTRGTVDEEWARKHHRKWLPPETGTP